MSQALPESIPIHGIVDFDMRSEFPGCGTDDLEVTVVFEDDELGVADSDRDGGCRYSGRRGGYDVVVGWRVDI